MIAAKYRFHGHGSLRYLYKNGEAIRSRHFTLKYVRNPQRKNPRFAVVVSKKVHKSAVGRNRIRRRVYEHFRQNILPTLSGTDAVIIVTNGEVLTMPHLDLKNNLDELYDQMRR